MKNVIIVVLGGLLILQTAYLLVGRGKSSTERTQHASEVSAEVAPEPMVSVPASPVNEEVPKQTTEQLEKAHNLIASLFEQNQQLEEEAKPSFKKGLEQVMQSPEMEGMLKNRAKQQAIRKYAGLLAKLGLSPDQEAVLNELFMQREQAEMKTGINWMTGNIEEAQAQSLAARDQIHQQILEQFGQETLDSYRYWEDTEGQRTAVSRMNRKLGESSVDEGTSDWLVGMMHETQSQFEELDRLSKPENFDPRVFTPEYRESIMGQVDQLHATYVQNAQTYLTPDQLTGYETTLQQQRLELDRFLEFTHQSVKK